MAARIELVRDGKVSLHSNSRLAVVAALLVAAPQMSTAADLAFQVGGHDPASSRPATLQLFLSGTTGSMAAIHLELPFPTGTFLPPQVIDCLSQAQCHYESASGRVIVDQLAEPGSPIQDQLLCEMALRVRPGTPVGLRPLAVEALEAVDLSGQAVAVNVVGNVLQVLDSGAGSGVLQFLPPPDPSCRAESTEVIVDSAGQSEIALALLELSAQAPLAISCGGDSAVSVVGGGEQAVPGPALVPIALQCLPGHERGRVACVEASSGGERAVFWDVDCGQMLHADGFEAATPGASEPL